MHLAFTLNENVVKLRTFLFSYALLTNPLEEKEKNIYIPRKALELA